ncbi:MAG: hypothetical protein AAF711_00820 [Planctomycetota bacterium]
MPEELATRGASYDQCPKIVIAGSEADFGPISVNLIEQFEIQPLWTSILASRPYHIWYASGYLRVMFYDHEDADSPIATLLVNASGAAHIADSTEPRRYFCPGLHELLIQHLEKEAARGG